MLKMIEQKNKIVKIGKNLAIFIIVILILIAIFFLRSTFLGSAEESGGEESNGCPQPSLIPVMQDMTKGCYSKHQKIDSADKSSLTVTQVMSKCYQYCISAIPKGETQPNTDCKCEYTSKTIPFDEAEARPICIHDNKGKTRMPGHTHDIPFKCEPRGSPTPPVSEEEPEP